MSTPDDTGRKALAETLDRLLGDGGCPWDRAQTLESLRPYLLEEAFELVEAIDGGRPESFREELGDVLFMVEFLGRLGARRHGVGFDAAAAASAEKMQRRHPWVFGDAEVHDVDGSLAAWEREKAKEKASRGRLAGVPSALPALLRATRVGEKVAAVGYDFADAEGARAAVRQEAAELDAALDAGDLDAVAHELGDALFAHVNLARKLGLDAESLLRASLDRFRARFEFAESRARELGVDLATLDDATRDAWWNEAKAAEPGDAGP